MVPKGIPGMPAATAGAVPPSVCLPTRSPRGWLVVRPPSSSAAPTRFRRWPRCPGRPRQCRLARPLSQAAPPARHRARHWWPLPTHPRPHPQLPRRRVDPKGRNRVTRQEQSGRSYRVPEIELGSSNAQSLSSQEDPDPRMPSNPDGPDADVAAVDDESPCSTDGMAAISCDSVVC